MNTKGILYWITGLSGAGKTTIGTRLYYELKKQKDNVVLLDGDILKNIVDDSLGYTEEDRRKRAMKYAGICKMLTDQGIIVICCTIAMYDEVRDWNRKNNNGYVEIFLDVPVSVLMERDQKGMYSRQKKGELKNLAGIDMQVEFPKNPDIVIHNDGRYTVRQCVEKILHTWGGYFSRALTGIQPIGINTIKISRTSISRRYLPRK
jgi:adenylylsulfate kinase